MKSILFVSLFSISALSCNVKFPFKKISIDETYSSGRVKYEVLWYEISRLDNIHEFVNVSKNGKDSVIFESNQAIIFDMFVRNDSIFLLILPNRETAYFQKRDVFGMKIIEDTIRYATERGDKYERDY
jgi:hypothetical protein